MENLFYIIKLIGRTIKQILKVKNKGIVKLTIKHLFNRTTG